MTPVKQRFLHRPDEGQFGDCHRAAVASVLDLPLDEVPHFYEGGRAAAEAERVEREFLRSRGLVPVVVAFEADIGRVLKAMGAWNAGTHYLLGGMSKNGVGHTVVCLGGEIVHDPAIDGSGIVGPMEDGLFWITFFGAAVVAQPEAKHRTPAPVYVADEPRCLSSDQS